MVCPAWGFLGMHVQQGTVVGLCLWGTQASPAACVHRNTAGAACTASNTGGEGRQVGGGRCLYTLRDNASCSGPAAQCSWEVGLCGHNVALENQQRGHPPLPALPPALPAPPLPCRPLPPLPPPPRRFVSSVSL